MLAHALKSLAAWPRSRLPRRVQLWAAYLENMPIGRRFQPRRGELGLQQRWYVAQPTTRVVVSGLELGEPATRDLVEIAVRCLCARHPDALGVCEERAPTRLSVRPLTAADVVPWFDAERCCDLESLAAKYDRTANGRTSTVEVSNVGRIIGVPSGADVWLTQGADYHAALFVLTVATSDSDGSLRCCLSYPEPLVDRALASRFMRAFERRLFEMRESSMSAVSAVDLRASPSGCGTKASTSEK